MHERMFLLNTLLFFRYFWASLVVWTSSEESSYFLSSFGSDQFGRWLSSVIQDWQKLWKIREVVVDDDYNNSNNIDWITQNLNFLWFRFIDCKILLSSLLDDSFELNYQYRQYERCLLSLKNIYKISGIITVSLFKLF